MRIAVVIGSPLRYSAQGRTGACLLHEAHRRGHEVFCLEPESISKLGGPLVGEAFDLAFPPTQDIGTFWRRLQLRAAGRRTVALELEGLDALIWRRDPPLNREAARLLARLADTVTCLNDPRALLSWSSKAQAPERFGHLMPPAKVATTWEELREALEEIPGTLYLKPLEEAGGRGIVRLAAAERHLLERKLAAEPLLTGSIVSGAGLLVQQEVRGHSPGDVRVLCLDGRVLGAMRRIPRAGEFRANVSQGARVAPARLSAGSVSRWEAVAEELSAEGAALLGLDVVGDWLLEVNVVSPGGIPSLNALYGLRLERDVLSWIERKAKAAL